VDALLEMISSRGQQLLGRLDGPLHFRLVVMPTVVTLLAIRAGVLDARGGRPAFLWALFFHPPGRAALVRSAVKDIGRVFVVACVLDSVYQLAFLRVFYPGLVLVVAVACAIVPYVVIRGPANRLARLLTGRRARRGDETGTRDSEERGGHG
jgi:hypothetical protein